MAEAKKKKDNSDAGSPSRPSVRPTDFMCANFFFRLMAFASMVAARPRVIPPVPSAKSETYVGEGGLGWWKGRIFLCRRPKNSFLGGRRLSTYLHTKLEEEGP